MSVCSKLKVECPDIKSKALSVLYDISEAIRPFNYREYHGKEFFDLPTFSSTSCKDYITIHFTPKEDQKRVLSIFFDMDDQDLAVSLGMTGLYEDILKAVAEPLKKYGEVYWNPCDCDDEWKKM